MHQKAAHVCTYVFYMTPYDFTYVQHFFISVLNVYICFGIRMFIRSYDHIFNSYVFGMCTFVMPLYFMSYLCRLCSHVNAWP